MIVKQLVVSSILLAVAPASNASKIAELTMLELDRSGVREMFDITHSSESKDWVWMNGSNGSIAMTSTMKSKISLGMMCFANHGACTVIYGEYGSCSLGQKYPIKLITDLETRIVSFTCAKSESGITTYAVKPKEVEDLLIYGSSLQAITGHSTRSPQTLSLSGSSRAITAAGEAIVQRKQ